MLPVAAAAQPLDALVAEALRNNREILAAQKKYEALRQRPAQESSLPDPTVSLGYTSNGGPWPGAGLGINPTSNVGVMVSQEVPFPGKQRLRGEIAGREAEAGFDEYLAVRLSVVSRLKQAYHELHHAVVDIEFVERNQELLRNMLRISEARYAVGRAAQQDIFKAQTQFAVFETQRVRYQQEQASKQIEINALLNRPQHAAHIEIPAEMTAGAMPATLEEMLAAARAHAPLLGARRQRHPAQRTGGQPGAQGLLPRLHPLRRLLQPGRHAAHVAGPGGFQAARVLLAQAARRRWPSRSLPPARRGTTTPKKRWPWRRASARSTAWPRRRASWSTCTRNR